MRVRFYILMMLFIIALVAAAILPSIPQPLSYHELIDQRSFLGVPNFLNVASNLIFLFVGIEGLVFLRRVRVLSSQKTFTVLAECWPYLIVFISAIMVSVGSAYYHWEPENSTLFWDRLPIATGVMGLLAATVIERVDIRQGLKWLPALVMIGMVSVVYWDWSERQGAGNLNFYIVVQFCSILLIVLLAILFPSRYTRGTDIYMVVFLYGLAKLAEMLDEEIYHFHQIVSGHTLKHLLAALAIYWILRMLKKRKLLESLDQADQKKKGDDA